jgi:RimJ/RimL family protein N-acetyltransferase
VDLSIRPATVDDAARLAVVHVASWRRAYRGLLPDDLLDGLSAAARERRWTSALAAPHARGAVLVVERDGQLLGFASVGLERSGEPADTDGELYAIYLDPDHWRHGVGTALHDAALDRLGELGFRTASLWVLVGNERAMAFYRRNGWREDGTTRVDIHPSGVELPEIRFRRPVGTG